jgi:hypothetical protein
VGASVRDVGVDSIRGVMGIGDCTSRCHQAPEQKAEIAVWEVKNRCLNYEHAGTDVDRDFGYRCHARSLAVFL